MKTLGHIILIAIIVALLAFAADIGWSRVEKSECNEWAANPPANPANWQKQQCEHHRIIVEWPEK